MSGQGPALIPHKYRGNPLTPHLAANNTSVLKWRAMYLGRHVLIVSLYVIEEKSHIKKEKEKKSRKADMVGQVHCNISTVNFKSSDIIE